MGQGGGYNDAKVLGYLCLYITKGGINVQTENRQNCLKFHHQCWLSDVLAVVDH
jgi:hypothetical protein